MYYNVEFKQASKGDLKYFSFANYDYVYLFNFVKVFINKIY